MATGADSVKAPNAAGGVSEGGWTTIDFHSPFPDDEVAVFTQVQTYNDRRSVAGRGRASLSTTCDAGRAHPVLPVCQYPLTLLHADRFVKVRNAPLNFGEGEARFSTGLQVRGPA